MRLARLLPLVLAVPLLAFTQENPTRFEAGAQVEGLRVYQPGVTGTFGAGGRFGYRARPWLTIEGQYDRFDNAEGYTETVGKNLVLAGVKAGRRTGQFGIFGKLRPGVMTFGSPFHAPYLPADYPQTSGTKFALDVGGVLEWYSQRSPFFGRVDVGDTIVFFGSPLIYPAAVRPSRGATTHNLLLSLGIGVRF